MPKRGKRQPRTDGKKPPRTTNPAELDAAVLRAAGDAWIDAAIANINQPITFRPTRKPPADL